ncbi:unnamed protein product [Ambrosiozyma monospora]|uniref:Unnamed protein product n=1 Tax=Ambrosiozyma monospora TaxID=43982 RepID=A0ACB5UCI0_AMBMO|nr:unnamed protein product [Ambrosiozyma monospora]
MMNLALEQAKKCVPMDNAFCVGCVITHNGKVISTGYTRELEGNTHAEQNALAKYFAAHPDKELPTGCELYTTMEPCSFRLSGNKPCLNRILDLKKHFTTVYVGVMEPGDFVKNNVSYDQLTCNGVSYLKVPGFQEKSMEVAKRGHKKPDGEDTAETEPKCKE